MVPKLHPKGSSFRGAAAYLLHDKGRATTSERVAWTETHNLATDDPQVAWRVMAATALDAPRRKREAGIKTTGRKSNDSVLHLTLSWHPDEKAGLTREEMMKAALGAVRALGAEDRQAIFVSHNDEEHAHVHVLLNRVSPADGRMLPSSKEKLNLSRWAEAYERERGKVLCEERAVNNAARQRGEYTRGEKNRPRHVVELESANDNHPRKADIRREQRAKDVEASRRDRETKKQQKQALAALEKQHRQKLKDIRSAARSDVQRAKSAVRDQFRPQWKDLLRSHDADMRAFEKREESFIGRVKNALKSIDFAALVRAGERRKAISDAFSAFASAGARLEGIRRQQEKESRKLAAQQNKSERSAAAPINKQRDAAIDRERTAYTEERTSLQLTHDLESAAQRATWTTRRKDRNAAYEAAPDFERQTGGQIGPAKPRHEAAMDDFAEQIRRQLERDFGERDPDDGRGR